MVRSGSGRPPAPAAPRDVALLSRKPKTRSELLAGADRARARGRVRKAVAEYRKALESDPEDPSVNVKLAPLLARIGDAEGATRCFRNAARKHLEAGFTDRAAAVNLAASGVFPLMPGFRLELARINLARGRRADAVTALVDGGRALARARTDETAITLLRKALEIEPWHPDAALALAPVLARAGRAEEARRLLDGLDARLRGSARRRARWVALRIWPGPRALWRWLRA